MDEVFKALADASRRQLLDSLNRRNGQTLRELCDGLDMARQSVSKHLAVLESAELVTTVRRGREKLHYLNAMPINAIAERWLDKYDRERAHALADLQTALEATPMSTNAFVYTTYIRTTPEQLWRALTEPAFTRRYWGGVALESDWRVGSPVRVQNSPDEEFADVDQKVLVADPYRTLSYTWHNYQPEHAPMFGWSAAELAERQRERRSTVTFELEPAGDTVKLTVTHDGFQEGSAMMEAVSGKLDFSGGWPQILAGLKTLLETGTV
ncbi:ArsR/SmtB family transcription factor [Actinocrispum wychmicini]|uniref:Uncharacterized protein YndB with AHSA1/START domain n=1 Tax=Actinocrispum wychmicini TaxID=1213861 RepID=A0A4V2S7V0_9PSEU|nr:metalloregulator ArsR/SmtB family transcription factor [Actinocrispum wychmicini]TCO61000.1 uncharacterized protein YndB with AHSA1/START domain [Actinocrispum wychmicini]